MSARRGSPLGAPVEPVEAGRLLRGSGRFVADLVTPGTLHAVFVRSTVPAGRLIAVDTAEARSAPGVVAVFTGSELADEVGPIPAAAVREGKFAARMALTASPRPVEVLAASRVCYVGQPVAVVVAKDRYLAEDAAALVAVSVDPEKPVLGAAAALSPGARRVHPDCPGNVAVHLGFTKGAAPAADDGLVIVEGRYRIGRQSGVSIECRGALARPGQDGRLEVWSSTQAPFVVRQAICAATGWDATDVRVRSPDVGGGFGPKVAPAGEDVVVAYLARRLGRAVAWIEDRYENLIAAPQARDQEHHTKLTVALDGRIVSWEDDFLVDVGISNPWMVGVVANTALHLLGPYRIPHARITGTAAFTNKAPTSQYRGAGRPEAAFALERSLDDAARRLGISEWKIREQNILGPEDLPYPQDVPYRDGVDIVYDGRDYRRVLDAARDLIPEAEIAELKADSGQDRTGVGVAAYIEATARGPQEPETARITLEPDGCLLVRTGTGPSGQSHETVFAQVAADAAKRAMPDIHVITGDTGEVPQGLGSFASRSAVIAGSAVHDATSQLVELAGSAVARALGISHASHREGGFHAPGRGLVTWQELATWFGPGGPLAGQARPEAVATFAPATVTWTMGVHVAVVRVDPATGSARVVRYGVAHEAGPPLNPRVVDGQVKGGAAQGIGGALLEEVRYDDAGQPLSATLADYLIPTSTDIPVIRLAHTEVPSELNPLGIRGVGESGTIGGYAAVAAAVDDALGMSASRVQRVPMDAAYLASLIPDDRP
jgi:aerobic carbon-monoxide dehydrogenase large subunit